MNTVICAFLVIVHALFPQRSLAIFFPATTSSGEKRDDMTRLHLRVLFCLVAGAAQVLLPTPAPTANSSLLCEANDRTTIKFDGTEATPGEVSYEIARIQANQRHITVKVTGASRVMVKGNTTGPYTASARGFDGDADSDYFFATGERCSSGRKDWGLFREN